VSASRVRCHDAYVSFFAILLLSTSPRDTATHDNTRNLRSVQGETQYAASHATLRRRPGVRPRCTYFDSAFAFSCGRDMTLGREIVRRGRNWRAARAPHGGEPMLQRTSRARERSCSSGSYRVMIETSGAHALDALPLVAASSPSRRPASGESKPQAWESLRGPRGLPPC